MILKMNKSETFCILPWTHIATWTDGSALLCCVAQNSHKLNFNKDSVDTIWNSEHFKDARVKMLKGEKVSACDHCYKEEAAGIRSHRINENVLWENKLGEDRIAELISSTKKDGTLTENFITLDLRLGNTCNLQCVMCRPQDSSMWLSNAKKLKDILETDAKWDWEHKSNIDTDQFEWYKKEKLWKDFEPMFSTIRHLIFAGGEPLLIKEHLQLIKNLVKFGYSKNIELRYHTNGTIISEEIVNLWKEFKFVEVMASIDAWGEHLEYVRYPANWELISGNLKKLDKTPDNIDVKVLATIHAMNVYYIPEFAENMLKSKFKRVGHLHHSGVFHAGTVHWPRYLSIKVFPKSIKSEIRKKWESFEELKYNKQWREKILSQLDFMDSEDLSDLYPQFIDYRDKLDKIRNTSFKKTFPEFYKVLENAN